KGCPDAAAVTGAEAPVGADQDDLDARHPPRHDERMLARRRVRLRARRGGRGWRERKRAGEDKEGGCSSHDRMLSRDRPRPHGASPPMGVRATEPEPPTRAPP